MSSSLLLRVSSYSSDEDDGEWRPITPPPSSPGRMEEEDNNANNKNNGLGLMATFVDGVQHGFVEATPTEMVSTALATARTAIIVIAIGFVRMGREGTLLLHHSMAFILSCLMYMLHRERNTSSSCGAPAMEEHACCTLNLNLPPSAEKETGRMGDDIVGIAIV